MPTPVVQPLTESGWQQMPPEPPAGRPSEPALDLGWEIAPSRLSLLGKVGSGNLGEVFEAELRDAANGSTRRVAVKRLPSAVGELGRAFRDELRCLHRASTRCHGVCRLLGTCEHQGGLCIVMRLYSGSLADLAGRMPGRALPAGRLLRYMAQVCRAMGELHGEGVLVQDLKPANLLWDEETDTVVVADFGISTLLEGQAGHMMPTSVKGSPHYMAPEQWDPERLGGISGKSDVWSFGCTMLELASGVPPWSGLTMMQIMQRVVGRKEHPAVPSTLKPPGLRALIVSCLAAAPADRPDFPELAGALGRLEREQTEGEAVERLLDQTSEAVAAEMQRANLEIDRLQAALLKERSLRERAEKRVRVLASSYKAAEQSNRGVLLDRDRIEPNDQVLFVGRADQQTGRVVFEAVCARRGVYVLDEQCVVAAMQQLSYLVGQVLMVGEPAPDGTVPVWATFDLPSTSQEAL